MVERNFYTSSLNHWSAHIFLYSWDLKLVQLVKTAPKHNRCIEDLGDDILRWAYLDFIYVHPIVLWGTCKAQQAGETHKLEKHTKVA